jgi:hypothetical protein
VLRLSLPCSLLIAFFLCTPSASGAPSAAIDTVRTVNPRIQVREQPTSHRLLFRITRVERDMAPTEEAPFRKPGGDWMFLDAVLNGEEGAVFSVGVRPRGSASGTSPMQWGEVIVAVPSPDAGRRFVAAFARAFEVKDPPARKGSPVVPVRLNSVVLGQDVERAADGSFGDKGPWTATKWFVEMGEVSGEVYFNYDLTGLRGEFTEKEPQEANALLEAWALAVRDGRPLGPSPEGVPALTRSGPTFEPVRKVAERYASIHGVLPSGDEFIISEKLEPRGELVRIVALDAKRTRNMMRLDGRLLMLRCTQEAPAQCLAVETVPKQGNDVIPSDPKRYWWWDERRPKRAPLGAEILGKNASIPPNPLSPDGRYIAVQAPSRKDGPTYPQSLYILDRQSGRSVLIGGTDKGFEIMGWERAGKGWKVLLRSGYPFGTNATASQDKFTADAATGTTTATPERQDREYTDSPDGRLRWSIEPERGLAITELASGQTRVLPLEPELLKHLANAPPRWRDAALRWASPRYLAIRFQRFSLVDVQHMKRSFPFPPGPNGAGAFSHDFTTALMGNEEGMHLARIRLPPQ